MKKFDSPIFVTKPFMPPYEEFCNGLREIWNNQWLTNNGQILKRYHQELSRYFSTEADNICLFANGMLALQIAIQGMGIKGEVITTPFTFVATTHALHINNITPVFCDIEKETFSIDPKKIENLITPLTKAILAVHVFGHPCDLDALQNIAVRHNLFLIYDAAHAFGVRVNGKSIGYYGDVSMFSFHATKIYHSIEGGMLIFKNKEFGQKFNYLKNFGFKNEVEVVMQGTNAKMNELQALMGSIMLNYIDMVIEKKRKIYEAYRDQLIGIEGLTFIFFQKLNIEYTYSYIPILINESLFGISRDAFYAKLKEYNIFARRYFYPLVNNFSCYSSVKVTDSLSVSESISKEIITLPTYFDLSIDDVCRICDIIKKIKRKAA